MAKWPSGRVAECGDLRSPLYAASRLRTEPGRHPTGSRVCLPGHSIAAGDSEQDKNQPGVALTWSRRHSVQSAQEGERTSSASMSELCYEKHYHVFLLSRVISEQFCDYSFNFLFVCA